MQQLVDQTVERPAWCHGGNVLTMLRSYGIDIIDRWCVVDVDLCASGPCENGGTCTREDDGYRCDCPVCGCSQGGTTSTCGLGKTGNMRANVRISVCVCVCVCVCVRACVRACERACVRACVGLWVWYMHARVYVCLFVSPNAT